MAVLLQDLRYASRIIKKHPGVTAMIVLSLALGIGANTVIFSVVNAVLFNSLPYPDSGRLVTIWFTPQNQPGEKNGINSHGYMLLRDNNRVFESVGAARLINTFNVAAGESVDGSTERVPAHWYTPGMVQTLGVPLLMGHWPVPEAGGMVISHGLWQRLYGGAPDVLERTILVDGGRSRIIGVTQEGFELLTPSDLWLYQNDDALRVNIRSPNRIYTLVGRLKPGVTMAQAQEEVRRVAGFLANERPEVNQGWTIWLETLHDTYMGTFRRPLLIVQAAVLFVLLIACANVASLLLAQAAARHKELALRAALGSGRWRIVRQLLTHSALLALAGGAVGVALAWAGLRVFESWITSTLPSITDVNLNGAVLQFTLLLSLGTAIVFGVLPALHVSRPDLNAILRESTRSTTGGLVRQRLRSAFVVVQISLVLVLLIGAGLMLKSFARVSGVRTGLEPTGLITFQVSFPRSFYRGAGNTPGGAAQVELSPRIDQVSDQILERLNSIPGVESATLAVTPPLGGVPMRMPFVLDGQQIAPADRESMSAEWYPISPGYFSTLKVPVVKGREFVGDDLNGLPVAIINTAMAERYWPTENPIGKRLQIDVFYDQPREIVGVVGDVQQNRFNRAPQPQLYVPRTQLPRQMDMTLSQRIMLVTTFVVRTSGDPEQFVPAFRAAVRDVDSAQAVSGVRTVNDYAAAQLQDLRQYAAILTTFSVAAVVLAMVGVFGVVAYSVSQRRNEIGIRMAVGAGSRDVLGLVLKQGMLMIVAGILLGALSAFALTRTLQNLLWGVTPTDPATFALAAFSLAIVGLLACYFPARRALKVDPIIALRDE